MRESIRELLVALLAAWLIERAGQLALWIVRTAARLLPDEITRERYERDWDADLKAVQGDLRQLQMALGMAVSAVQMRSAAEIRHLSAFELWSLFALLCFVAAGAVSLFYLAPVLATAVFFGVMSLVPAAALNDASRHAQIQHSFSLTLRELGSGWILLPYVALAVLAAILIWRLMKRWSRRT